jgi:hypothetical protein
MIIEKMKEAEQRLCKEIDNLLAKPTWVPADVEMLGKIYDMCKDSSTIEAMDRYEYSGSEPYSNLARPYYDNRMMHDGSYGWDVSMERGRSPMTGRYVSRGDGYSGHSIRDRAVAMLEGAMDSASSPYEREELEGIINQVRNKR